MGAKWSAASRGTRVAAVVVALYVIEAVVIKATADNQADGDASIVIGGFATVFGTVILALAFHTDYVTALRLRRRLRGAAESAPATVAAVVSFHGSDFSYPVFEYTTPDGVTRRHADASACGLAVGAQAVVRYSVEDPDRAVGPLGRFHAAVFAVLVGLGVSFAVLMPVLAIQSIAY